MNLFGQQEPETYSQWGLGHLVSSSLTHFLQSSAQRLLFEQGASNSALLTPALTTPWAASHMQRAPGQAPLT